MMENAVECCFCGEDVISSSLDPCDITIATNWDREPGERNDQFFWCHYKCFKKTLHSDVKPHLLLHLLLDEK